MGFGPATCAASKMCYVLGNQLTTKGLSVEDATKETASPAAHPIVKHKPSEPGKAPGPEVSTEITVQGYITTAQTVLALTEKYTGVVYEVTTKAGMEAAKESRRELVKLRTSLETTREGLKAPVIKLGKDIDAQAKAITAAILALEGPIDKQISTEEERKKTEREAAAKKEQERVQDLRSRITAITQMPLTVIGKPSEFMSEVLAKLDKIETGKAAWQEYEDQADEAIKVSREQLGTMLSNQVAAEVKAAQDAADAAERQRLADIEAAAKQVDDGRLAEIRAINRLPTTLLRSEPVTIQGHLDYLQKLDMTEERWGSRHAEAQSAKDEATAALTAILEDRIKAAEQARKEMERRKEEQARQIAEDAARKESERLEREAAEARQREKEAAEAKAREALDRVRAHATELLDALDSVVSVAWGLADRLSKEPGDLSALSHEEVAKINSATALINKARGIK